MKVSTVPPHVSILASENTVTNRSSRWGVSTLYSTIPRVIFSENTVTDLADEGVYSTPRVRAPVHKSGAEIRGETAGERSQDELSNGYFPEMVEKGEADEKEQNGGDANAQQLLKTFSLKKFIFTYLFSPIFVRYQKC